MGQGKLVNGPLTGIAGVSMWLVCFRSIFPKADEDIWPSPHPKGGPIQTTVLLHGGYIGFRVFLREDTSLSHGKVL